MLTGLRVSLPLLRELVEPNKKSCHVATIVSSRLDSRQIHVLVYAPNILSEMLPYSGEFSTVHTDHSESVHLRGSKGSQFVHAQRFSLQRTFPSLLRSKRVRPTT